MGKGELCIFGSEISLFKVKTPKVFAVAGLLLIFINVYDAASIIIYVHTTPLVLAAGLAVR
jgi:hypothetical protein